MKQQKARRPGEAELGERVNGERHVASHNESADDARDDRDDEPGRERVLHELVSEQPYELVHQWPSP